MSPNSAAMMASISVLARMLAGVQVRKKASAARGAGKGGREGDEWHDSVHVLALGHSAADCIEGRNGREGGRDGEEQAAEASERLT